MFRKTADGIRLADLGRGLRLVETGTDGSWAEVTLEGWVRTDGLGRTSREGHNAIVSRAGGEDLRDDPSGLTVARLLEGFLLDRLEDRDGWSRVRRSGWVRSAALGPPVGASVAPEEPRPRALVAAGRQLTTGATSLDVRTAPDGAELGQVAAGTPVTVVERGDRWTRIRIDGWVRSEELVTSHPDSVLVDISAAGLKASPDDYQGLRLRWTVQFVALERAEPERTDFYEGEPFILARAPDPSDGFVYIAVPEELLEAAESVRPLATIEVLVQVRTGRSALMGVPVLDLLAVF
ncbi:MAG: SH3 domain-containing protein [Gemmatimonadetes bacterium]|nr:SH3 domain-containing protein [Gemmatimonadota bacterium]